MYFGIICIYFALFLIFYCSYSIYPKISCSGNWFGSSNILLFLHRWGLLKLSSRLWKRGLRPEFKHSSVCIYNITYFKCSGMSPPTPGISSELCLAHWHTDCSISAEQLFSSLKHFSFSGHTACHGQEKWGDFSESDDAVEYAYLIFTVSLKNG